MRIRSRVERKEFFELLSSASSNGVDVARLGSELFERYPRDGEELIGRIKEHEHTGDSLTHEIVVQLDKTFVTPFDRDDAYRLAAAIDDVCDFVDETADQLGSWGVPDVPPTHARWPTSLRLDWVKISTGVAIAAGTYVGGWRIMRTIGQRL
jgi:uncharacterized protein